MAVTKLEYIWLDGYHPVQSLRSKTKIEKNSQAIWKIAQSGVSMALQQNRLLVVLQIVYCNLYL